MSLNAQQQAVLDADGNVLCCACPGSGKTRTLTEKVVKELMERPNSRILMTTFTRDAAEAMMRRVRNRLQLAHNGHEARVQQAMAKLNIGTFHSLAMRQLRQHGPVGRFLSAIEIRHVLTEILADLECDWAVEDAEMEISLHKAAGFPENADATLKEIVTRYEAVLASRKAQDFTDLMLRANKGMQSGDIPPIPADLALFDEFQDVDQLQFDWMMHIFRQTPNPRAIAVGDDDQSIYGFRRSLGYAGMMQFVRATGARVIKLGVNYRSTQAIVQHAVQLIELNLDRVQKDIHAARGAGLKPRVVELEENDSQGERLLQQLDELCLRNPPEPVLPGDVPPRFRVLPNQVAVLARSNQQLQSIEDVLRDARVPYHRMGRNFWELPVLSVFTTLLSGLCKKDGLGVDVALRWAGTPLPELRQLKACVGGDLYRLLTSPIPVRSGGTEKDWSYNVQAFLEICHSWPAMTQGERVPHLIRGVAAWMASVINETAHGVLQERKGRPQTSMMRKRVDLLALGRDQMLSWSGDLWNRLPENRRKAPQQDEDDGIPRVVLGTFHGSKGLEYDHVFLLDVVEGSVPKLLAEHTEEDVAEERRVFYVAMTRAKNALTLYTRRGKNPSEFLMEAGLA